MKKKKLIKKLELNKDVISSLKTKELKGGAACTVDYSCECGLLRD